MATAMAAKARSTCMEKSSRKAVPSLVESVTRRVDPSDNHIFVRACAGNCPVNATACRGCSARWEPDVIRAKGCCTLSRETQIRGVKSHMFVAFRQFVSALADGEKHPSRFVENDYRLAAAALLVHAASIDGEMSAVVRTKLYAVIKRAFDLDQEETNELLADATEAEHEAVDLYHFTSLINRSLDEAGRARIIEMMWEIVYADGRVTEFEDNLIWRAADLLGISARERIALRQRVAGEGKAPGDEV